MITLVGFTLLYGVLAVVEVGLLLRHDPGRACPEADPAAGPRPTRPSPTLALAY